jgi:hypothetical protein
LFFCQSSSGLGGPTIAATCPSGPGLGAMGPTEALGLTPSVGAGSFSPNGVPGMGTEVPSSREVPGKHTGTSSSSRIEGLNKSCVNTPEGVGSRLNLS